MSIARWVISLLLSIAGIALFILSLALLVVFTATALSILEGRGRARGRHSYLLVLAAAILLSLFIGMTVTSNFQTVEHWAENDLGTGLIFLSCVLVAGVLMIAFSALLPQRKRSGLRYPRVHLTLGRAIKTIGRLLELGALPLAVLGAWWAGESEGGFWVPVIFAASIVTSVFAAGKGMVYLAVRVAPASLDAVRKSDPRPPVLYLRGFREEEGLFVRIRSGEGCTVEQFLGPGIREAIGPLIALGSPEDRIAPEGAVRVYCTDATWKGTASRLMTEAGGIILVPSATAQVSWELRKLLEIGVAWKLCLVTPLEIDIRNEKPTRQPGWSSLRSALKTSLGFFLSARISVDDDIIAGSSAKGALLAFSDVEIPASSEVINLLHQAGLSGRAGVNAAGCGDRLRCRRPRRTNSLWAELGK